MRLSLSSWRLDYFTTEAVFCQALFWEAFEVLRTWIASHISVSTGVFQRLLVLFKGFLLSFQKSFFCLSAWRSSIIPHPRTIVNTFWHLFSFFFAEGCFGVNPFRLAAARQATFPKGTAFSGSDKVSGVAIRRPLGGAGERNETEGVRCQKRSFSGAPERVQSYIITLYRQRETQTGIDCGLYYPPESIQCCQDFPCKILSRKISAIFGDCYKTQNIVVFCLTCH